VSRTSSRRADHREPPNAVVDADGSAAMPERDLAHAAPDTALSFQTTLLDALGQAVIVSDPTGRIVFWNIAAERLYGYTAAEMAGEPVATVLPKESVDQARAIRSAVLRGETWSGDLELTRRDGTSFPALVTATPVLAVDGAVTACIHLAADLTARKQAEHTAKALSAIVTTTADAIFTKSIDGTILSWNRGAENLYGYASSDIIGQHVSLLELDPAGPEVQAILTAVAGGETVRSLDTVRRRRDGSSVAVSLTVSPLYDDTGLVWAASVIGRDITDRRRLEEAMTRHATLDALTGLPNRLLLTDRLAHALTARRTGTRVLAVLFVDVDRFRLVNAAHGYALGDAVLAALADRLRGETAGGDTLARFGGDEFVVVSPATDRQQIEMLAERICAAIAVPFDMGGTTIHLTASVGVAVAHPASSPDELIRHAQAAMYQAKAGGPSHWQLLDAASARRSSARDRLRDDLREALSRDDLEVHYQPVVELATGGLVGVEALARWAHPARGWVPPHLFIPLAEESDLVSALDRWVLRRACLEAAMLRQAGLLPLTALVAVNVSARNLADAGLLDQVRHSADDAGLPLTCLELEVTETGLLTDARAAGRVLSSLRELGVGVALDDFGTGYSPFTYLRQLPVSKLKIDRSFVQHIAQGGDDLAIAAAVIDLGRAVGIRTVAEGVETREQLELLESLGCLAGQGYLWSQALPSGQLAMLLGKGQGFDVAPRGTTDRRPVRRPAKRVTNEHGRHRIFRLHQDGASLATIAAALTSEGYRSPAGQRWHSSSVARVLADAAADARQKAADPAG
jgi:diguanylate cyclase (GGDEF)-like protein/PAS domain S-box-containing protein